MDVCGALNRKRLLHNHISHRGDSMSEDLLGARVGVVGPARVTVDSRAKLITPYLVRITGTYRCPPGTPGRLLVACVPIRLAAGQGGSGTGGGTIAGGEVGQVDADGCTHAFVIDLGPAATDQEEEPGRYRRGGVMRVVAKLFYDELADRLDWERFVADFAGAVQPGGAVGPVREALDARLAGASTRGPRWPRCQLVLAEVVEMVVVG
ncbi:hypothetical protein [Nocardia yamanashiensis]|uniref:hypothetical protein n=1 Tax=Nocardia yamanashiensis TaxID=209247 RepID=UPI000B176D46|nr:hypothetical protein [Nocardia yamanashiensis]